MAAKFIVDGPGMRKSEIVWHIGKPFNINPLFVTQVTVDGDEKFTIPYPNMVQVLTGTEAILYGCYIQDAVTRK